MAHMTTVERLVEEVLALTPEEREELLARVDLDRVRFTDEQMRAWDEEAGRRAAAVANGAPTIPWETVRERMFERIRAAKG